MATLPFPIGIYPSSLSWRLESNTQIYRSPLSGSVQTLERGGARWRVSMAFGDHQADELAELESFLHNLRGASGRFYLSHFGRLTPAGTAAGTGRVNGASQTGTSLITDGWTASQTGLFLPGDMIGVNGELKQITAQAASDVSGDATLAITPPLRESPPNNGLIDKPTPVGTFRLTDDNQPRVEYRRTLESLSFEAVEAF